MFKYIVGLSALLVAGCSAYFSVQGLATLYAGSFISVCIMAGSLEIGKLVSASYLHRYWDKISFLLKTYLILAVITLMAITSLGIFGFLMSAYQQSHSKIEMVEMKRETLESKKQSFVTDISFLEKRVNTLNEVRLKQEQRVLESGNYKTPRDQAYASIEKSNQEISEINLKLEENQKNISLIDQDLINLKIEESKSTDIGTLKFVSQLFNKNVETIVKWFTIIIVFVFDPLAVCLVIAYNSTLQKKENNKNIEKENPDSNSDVNINKSMKINYKDI
jgi:preprotein translocase subunit SecG